MDFDKEDFYNKDILIASRSVGKTNFLSNFLRSRQQLLSGKLWLQGRSTKSVCHNIISELKLQDRYNYQKCFCMNSKTDLFFNFLHSV